MKKILNRYTLGAVLIGFAVGFLASRQFVQIKETVRYVKGDTVTDSIMVPYPVTEYIPAKPNLPMKPDTIYIDSVQAIVQQVDTSAIIADYIVRRDYEIVAFDNKEQGKMVLWPSVQYNKLTGIKFQHEPNIKEITKTIQPKFVPFASLSYNCRNYLGAGGGVFYKHIGLEYKVNVHVGPSFIEMIAPNLKQDNKLVHEIGLKYKW